MELRVLKYFLTVAQEENITRAAEVLHTSQSNLSRQLGELEESLGKKLFIRGSRKITLTEEGMYLRKRAKEIVELTERTEAELMSFDATPSGVVHIGAAETRLMQTISESMLSLQKEYPEITFDIFSGSTLEVNEMVDKGLLDFAVMVAPIDLTKYDYIELPIRERTGLLMRKDNPLAKKKNNPACRCHRRTASCLQTAAGRRCPDRMARKGSCRSAYRLNIQPHHNPLHDGRSRNGKCLYPGKSGPH